MGSSLSSIERFKKNYLNENNVLNIINLGYLNNKDFFSLWDEKNWELDILDIVDGNFIDIRVNNIYDWDEIKNNSYDVVICKDFINNIEYFWLTMVQIEKIMKFGGFLFLSVPESNPNGFYSFSEKSLRSLIGYVNLNILEVNTEDSQIFLIARKNDESAEKIMESYEKDVINSARNNILKKYESELNIINESNVKLSDSIIRFKSMLTEDIVKDNKYCPFCQSNFDTFDSFGNPPRLNARCSKCGSLERDRFIYTFLKEKTDIFIKNSKIMQYSPTVCFYNVLSKMNNVEYVSCGSELNDLIDKVIDLEDVDFSDDSFDAIINIHTLDKVKDDIKAMEELYRVVKPSSEGGFVLINVPLLREKTFEKKEYNTPELRRKYYHDESRYRIYGEDIVERLRSVGFIVDRYDSEDIFNSKLIELYGILPDCLFICKKVVD